MKRLLSTSLVYFVLVTFVIGWWMLAFRSGQHSLPIAPMHKTQTLALKTSQLLEALSPLQRDALQSALSGHFPLMLELIEKWDRDAQALSQEGISNIQRLPSEHYLQAHILGHLLAVASQQSLRDLNCKMNLDVIQDDSGRLLQIKDTYDRYLPQTFVAASFLLAIAHPHEIIALPKGMRYLPQLYRPEKLSLIPENIDRTHSEKLYLAHPHLAFVAPYSHPPALEVLHNQNIQLYTIKYVDTLAEIQDNLLKVGHASNHILEAQLLKIFIEASFLSIDNRLKLLADTSNLPEKSLRILYLYYHQHFMMPTSRCLTGQLMERALAHCPHLTCQIPQNLVDWRIPFDQEKILQANPDCMLISTPTLTASQTMTHQLSILHQLKAFQSNRIFYLDEAIQDSPTQYIVLAYYDIYEAIAAVYCV